MQTQELTAWSQNLSSCGVGLTLDIFSCTVDLKQALLYEFLKPSLASQVCLKYIGKFGP